MTRGAGPARGDRSATLAIAAIAVGLSVATIGIVMATATLEVPGQFGYRAVNVLIALTFTGLGTLISLRRPRHPIGWLFASIGLLAAVNAMLMEWAAVSSALPVGMVPADPADLPRGPRAVAARAAGTPPSSGPRREDPTEVSGLRHVEDAARPPMTSAGSSRTVRTLPSTEIS